MHGPDVWVAVGLIHAEDVETGELRAQGEEAQSDVMADVVV
jgi:hypothetical protein